MAVYIPAIVVLIGILPFWRAKWLWLFCVVALSSFYQYKESIDTCKRYLTYSKYLKLAVVICIINVLFSLFIFSVITA